MAKFPVPSDAHLEQLIGDAHEFMPGPDMVRLEQTERVLSGHLQRVNPGFAANTLPWWFVLLLAGGFAAAAWWAGGQWKGGGPAEEQPAQGTEKRDNIIFAQPDKAQELHEKAGKLNESENSPVIYQKESD